jgi:condensin complex subunit 3
METMSDLYEDLEEDEEMVSPAQIGLMLVDWTDPSKTVYVLLASSVCSS